MTERVYPFTLTGPVDVGALHADAARLLHLLASQSFDGTIKDFWLLRLGPLKDLYGKRWDENQSAINDIVREEITDEIDEGGLCLRYDDLGYLVVFPPDMRADALSRLEALTSLIQDRAAGESFKNPLIDIWQAGKLETDGLRFSMIERAAPQASVIDGGEKAPPPSTPPVKSVKDVGDKRLIMGDVDLCYSPVWDVRENNIFAYLCEPEWTMADSGQVHEDSVEEAFRSKRARYVVDVTILHKAQEAFNELLEYDRIASIILPVHYDTLMDEDFEGRYLGECGNLVGTFYHLIALEIVGMPKTISPQAFSKMTAEIRPFCSRLFVRVKPDFLSWKELENDNLFAVSLDLRDDQRPEADILQTLEETMDHLTGTGLYACAHGLKSNSLSVAAICAGFDMVGSDTIAQTLEGWPMDDYFVKPLDLFKSLIDAK